MDPASDRDSDHTDSEGSVISKDTCELPYKFTVTLLYGSALNISR